MTIDERGLEGSGQWIEDAVAEHAEILESTCCRKFGEKKRRYRLARNRQPASRCLKGGCTM